MRAERQTFGLSSLKDTSVLRSKEPRRFGPEVRGCGSGASAAGLGEPDRPRLLDR